MQRRSRRRCDGIIGVIGVISGGAVCFGRERLRLQTAGAMMLRLMSPQPP
jgi:hypothetical protein